MLNALTIDVEDYFHVSAFESYVKKADWQNLPSRVEENTLRILDILDLNGIKATFFVLGWVAEHSPSLIRNIHQRGHEIACHGYGHCRVSTQSRQEFRDDIRKSKGLLERLIGQPVLGYRAPSYSISHDSLWAFDELLEAGFSYDSSVFPIRHDYYGIADWPRFPFCVTKSANGQWSPEKHGSAQENSVKVKTSRMMEFPISTLSIAGGNIPIAGGGYFRFFPYPFTRWGLQHINRSEGRPFIFYLHPWELDPGQPRMVGAGFKSKFRHYLNLHKTEERFRRILGDFNFIPLQGLARE